MRVRNVHTRDFAAPPAAVGRVLDTLASAGDCLWPRDQWPAMRLDRRLGVGAVGGHGPIRYTVERYVPGCFVRFRFTGPRGVVGTHWYDVEPLAGGGARLWHVVDVDVRGRARLAWLLALRPLHDALIEDSLDRAALALGEAPVVAPWSPAVRALRTLLAALRQVRGRRAGVTGPGRSGERSHGRSPTR
jgi:hypothetical protein